MRQEQGQFYTTRHDHVRLWFYFQERQPDKVAVFVPGNGVNHTELEDLAFHFQDNGYSVLLYDPRGHGYSDKLQKPEGYALEKLAQDLRELLEHVEVSSKYTKIFVGQSTGAMTGIFYQGTQVPPLFNALILLTPSWDYTKTTPNWANGWALRGKGFLNRPIFTVKTYNAIANYAYMPLRKALSLILPLYPIVDFKHIVAKKRLNGRWYWGSKRVHQALSYLRDLWVVLNMRYGSSWSELTARFASGYPIYVSNVEEQLRRITVPTLFIAGEADIYVDYRKLPRLTELVAGPNELFVIPGATHTLSFTHPEHCWIKIREFLANYGLLPTLSTRVMS